EYIIGDVELFLEVIYEKKKEFFEEVIDKYQQYLVEKMVNGSPNVSVKEFNFDYAKNTFISKYPQLLEKIEKSIFYHMRFQFNKDKLTKEGTMEIPFKDSYRSQLLQIYFLGLTLSALLPREEALNLSKIHIIRKWEKPPLRPTEIDNLEEFEGINQENRVIRTHKRHGLMGEGRYILKIERCLYGEVVQDLEDLELAYTHECYIDHVLPTMKNKNFVLTRTKTVMQGDSYCDICYHDKRIVKEVIHPSDE
ncbi:unnamed protein product, partial [marine sediment metagenome]